VPVGGLRMKTMIDCKEIVCKPLSGNSSVVDLLNRDVTN
jgi:hypothetical protein